MDANYNNVWAHLILLCFALLCFPDVAFFKCEGKTLPPCRRLQITLVWYFISVIWTHACNLWGEPVPFQLKTLAGVAVILANWKETRNQRDSWSEPAFDGSSSKFITFLQLRFGMLLLSLAPASSSSSYRVIILILILR